MFSHNWRLQCILSKDRYAAAWAHRERVFIIGIRKDVQLRAFEWPTPFNKCLSLTDVLGPPSSSRQHLSKVTHDADGVALNQTVRHNLLQFQAFLDENPQRQEEDFIVDVGGSKVHFMSGRSPCLTASRCKSRHGYWSHLRQRFLIPRDFFRLQGVWPGAYRSGDQDDLAQFPQNVLGEMVGNSISLCVLQRLVRSIFHARGLLNG